MMAKPRLSLRTLLILVGAFAIYLGLMVRTNAHSVSHAKQFLAEEANQLDLWPEGELSTINGFTVLNEPTLAERLLLRSQINYSYRAVLVEVPGSDSANYQCKSSFTVGPFSSTLISHEKKLISSISYSKPRTHVKHTAEP